MSLKDFNTAYKAGQGQDNSGGNGAGKGADTQPKKEYNRVPVGKKLAVEITAVWRGDPHPTGEKVIFYGKVYNAKGTPPELWGRDIKNVIFISKSKPAMGLAKLKSILDLVNPNLTPGDLENDLTAGAFKGWVLIGKYKIDVWNNKEYDGWEFSRLGKAGPNMPEPVETQPNDADLDAALIADLDLEPPAPESKPTQSEFDIDPDLDLDI